MKEKTLPGENILEETPAWRMLGEVGKISGNLVVTDQRILFEPGKKTLITKFTTKNLVNEFPLEQVTQVGLSVAMVFWTGFEVFTKTEGAHFVPVYPVIELPKRKYTVRLVNRLKERLREVARQ